MNTPTLFTYRGVLCGHCDKTEWMLSNIKARKICSFQAQPGPIRKQAEEVKRFVRNTK